MTVEEPQDELNAWLREAGIEGPRRIVRTSESGILVSKFEPGFAQLLLARLEALPELFDIDAVRAAHAELATREPAATRVHTWHQAMLGLLTECAKQQQLDADQIAEVEAGIDSVAALLDSVLFMGPLAGSNEPASEAERSACGEALERLDGESSLFTRQYGLFEGKLVVNHCPGSRFARELFEQGWAICAGTPT